jgi:hypothetical protein
MNMEPLQKSCKAVSSMADLQNFSQCYNFGHGKRTLEGEYMPIKLS